ncbi:MAG: hypothetical protein ABIU63_16275 [Chitinophagaceae bacterium]
MDIFFINSKKSPVVLQELLKEKSNSIQKVLNQKIKDILKKPTINQKKC